MGHCCTGFSPVAVSGGSSLQWFSCFRAWAPQCGAWVQLLRGMWDLPRSGIEPVSPAMAGRFFTTEPLVSPESPLKCKTYCPNISA